MTQEAVKQYFNYRNGSLYWKIRPSNEIKKGQKAGHKNKRGYVIIKCKGKSYRAARLIFLWHHGYLPSCVDHIDRNKSNDSINNLRGVTVRQNNYNKGKWKPNAKSKYKGVSFKHTAKKNKWFAQIMVYGKNKILGHFEQETDAALAYNKAAIKHFGEFAFLNKI